MGVSSTANRAAYAGNGTTTAFAFPYYFFALTDLKVYAYDSLTGSTSLLVLNTGYTISGTPNSLGLYVNGANVVFSPAPATGTSIVIVRDPPEIQNYSLLQNGLISSTALVQQLDYLTLLIQRLEDQVNRAVTLSDGMPGSFSGSLPATASLLPNSYVQINSTGTGFTLSPNPATGVATSYAAFAAGTAVLSVPLFTLPAGAKLSSLVIKHSAAFAASGLTACFAQVGVTSDPGAFLDGFDVKQAPGDQVFDNVELAYIGSFSGGTIIYLTMNASGANLSALTAGNVSVYYSYRLL